MQLITPFCLSIKLEIKSVQEIGGARALLAQLQMGAAAGSGALPEEAALKVQYAQIHYSTSSCPAVVLNPPPKGLYLQGSRFGLRGGLILPLPNFSDYSFSVCHFGDV